MNCIQLSHLEIQDKTRPITGLKKCTPSKPLFPFISNMLLPLKEPEELPDSLSVPGVNKELLSRHPDPRLTSAPASPLSLHPRMLQHFRPLFLPTGHWPQPSNHLALTSPPSFKLLHTHTLSLPPMSLSGTQCYMELESLRGLACKLICIFTRSTSWL